MNSQHDLCHSCVLCKVVKTPEGDREIQDTLLDKTDHFQWVPALGAFVEGYSLIISKNHHLNTGCFNVSIIEELELFIFRIIKTLEVIYNNNCIVFEHGSVGNSHSAGSCIDHHHLHIVPIELTQVPEMVVEKFVSLGQISSMKDLKRFHQNKIPYIYFMNSLGEHDVFEARDLPRQFLRQVIAAEYGCVHDWDWSEKPFLGNIRRFVKELTTLNS